jgi:hypothetical protein
MDRKDFRPNESSSSSNSTSKQYDLRPENDSRKSFYGKAKVRTENGKLILRSYDTDVAYIENGHAVVTNTQSPTTVRHVKEFLKQNGYKADTKQQIEKDYTEYRAKDFDSLEFPSGKSSALTHSEQLDYDDYVEYSNANNKYVKVKNGYGDYEYIKYSEIVNKDGSSKKPIERNVIGYPTLYSEGGQKAYGFNKSSYNKQISEEYKASKEYSELSKKNPEDKKKLKEISREETQHAKELKKLEKKESKSEIKKHQETQSKLKENTHVEITSKDFHGVKGTILRKPEYDKRDKEYYYTIYNDNRNSGLGLVTNVRVKDLKVLDK